MWPFRRKRVQTSTVRPSVPLEPLPLLRPDIAWQDPWSPLETAAEQHGLQRELVAELSPAHPLWGTDPIVFARHQGTDDILVGLNDGRFALVHLLWHGHVDQLPATYPSTAFYPRLDALREDLAAQAQQLQVNLATSRQRPEVTARPESQRPASVRATWAYDFTCDKAMAEIGAMLTATGLWRWIERDNEAFGSYIAAVPCAGLQVRIYDLDGYDSNGPTYTVDCKMDADCPMDRATIEHVFWESLRPLAVRHITQAAYFD